MIKPLLCIIAAFYTTLLSATGFNTDTVRIESDILHETRSIILYETSGIGHSDSVEVIYLLGDEFSKYWYDLITKEFPEKKIVGVGILNTNRRRDLLPINQPDEFLEFIEYELIPEVESNFRVKKRILFGHSFEGGFTLNSLILRPGLFDEYIAASPIPIMKMVDSTIYTKTDSALHKDIRLYIGYGSKDMKQVRKWCIRLQENLSGIKFSHINLKIEVYPDENHNSTSKLSLIRGLKYY
jgi:predicted alpha/beta superfamily hydrolase